MANPPNFRPGIGRLTTDRFDFQDHLDGVNPPGITDFRHTANQIDMNPPAINGALTVQDSFSQVAAFISSQANIGQGFATVGDGYDTWHAADGTINFDSTTPSLDELLNPILETIINNTTPIHGFERIKHGGIIVIKAGTYIVKKPINVPAGIMLMGEGYGTKIVNATSLDLSVSPPVQQTPCPITSIVSNLGSIQITTTPAIANLADGDYVNINGSTGSAGPSPPAITPINGTWSVRSVNTSGGHTTFILDNSTYNSGSVYHSTGGTFGYIVTMAPVFKILSDGYRSITDSPSGSPIFMFSRSTIISNMVIGDNFIENTILGDTTYLNAQSKTNSTYINPPPLVLQEAGSNLLIYDTSFVGKILNGTSGYAISLDNTFPASNGSILKVRNCFIDGFSQPISFLPTAGSKDYLEVTNNKIRAFGALNGDGVDLENNCVILSNVCNINVSDNYLYGQISAVNTSVGLNALPSGGVPVRENKSRIVVSSNNAAVNKLSGSTINYVPVESDLDPTTLQSYATIVSFGNNMDDFHNSSFKIFLDAGNEVLSLTSSTADITQDTISLTGNEIDLTTSGSSNSISIHAEAAGSVSIISENTASLISTGALTINSSAEIDLSNSGANLNISTDDHLNISSTGSGDMTLATDAGTIAINSGTFINAQADLGVTISATTSGNVQLTAASGNVNLSAANVNITSSAGHVKVAGTITGNESNNDPLSFGRNSISLSSVAHNGTYTLANTEFNSQIISLSGTVDGYVKLILPIGTPFTKFIDAGLTSALATNACIYVATDPGLSPAFVTMSPGENLWIFSDGTNIYTDRKNRTVSINNYASGSGFGATISTSSSTSYVDSAVLVTIHNAVLGDTLLINGLLSGSNVSGITQATVTVVDGFTTDLVETTVQFGTDEVTQVPISTTRSVTGDNAFTVIVKVRYKSLSSTSFINAPSTLNVQLIRP